MTVQRSVPKDVHGLLKNIRSVSNGQAEVTDLTGVTEWKTDDLQHVRVSVCPSEGLYEGGNFTFKVRDNRSSRSTLNNKILHYRLN